MPRQRLAPGEHGKIAERVDGQIFFATTYLRLYSGKLREREASSRKSAEDARRELKRRIAAELEAGEPTGVINRRTTLSELFEAWIPTKVAEKWDRRADCHPVPGHVAAARQAAVR